VRLWKANTQVLMGRLGIAVRISSSVETEAALKRIRGVREESNMGPPEASVLPSLFRVNQSCRRESRLEHWGRR
jgi:hypothetical protein